jgi:hypothetical protein
MKKEEKEKINIGPKKVLKYFWRHSMMEKKLLILMIM